MLEWLKKLGGAKPWQNKVGLEGRTLELLVEDLGALEKVDSDLSAATLRYVLDGEGEEILDQLAVTPGVSAALKLDSPVRGVPREGITPRSLFFERVRCADPRFFIRLGKTFEAASRHKASNPINKYPQFANLSGRRTFGDPRLDWLEILLFEASQLNPHSWPRTCKPCAALNAALLEAILEIEGHPPTLLVRTAFQPALQRFGAPPLEPLFKVLPGLPDGAVRHHGVMIEILNNPDFKQRVHTLGMMKDCAVPLEPFLEKLVEMALDSSKQVREQAQIVLVPASQAARPLLEAKVCNGENDERAAAARLLWRWEGEKVREFLAGRLAEEKNKKVAQAIQDLINVPVPKSTSGDKEDPLQLPPLPTIPDHLPLGPDTERAWMECLAKVNDGITRINASASGRQQGKLQPIPKHVGATAFAAWAGGKVKANLSSIFHASWTKEIATPLKAFWQRPELQPVHLVRFLIQVEALKPDDEQHARVFSYGYWLEGMIPAYRRTHPELGLRELAAAFAAAGLNPDRVGRGILGNFYGARPTFQLPPALIWPYWAEHVDMLEKVFAPPPGDFMDRYYQKYARGNAFEMLSTFPKPPARLERLLWDIALGPKSERAQAQRCLENVPDKIEHLTAALKAGVAENRIAAADWLARLGEKSVVEPLLDACKREKNEAAKSAIMSALEQLGAPVEQFLDRANLLKESEKGLSKGIPEDLKWFPFNSLPAVHWQDTGKQVQPEIIQWWLLQGFKLKNPEPGALLRRYCANFKPAEREVLGQFVLDAWIGEDTAPIAREEAEKRAREQARQMAHYAQYLYQHAQSNPQTQVTAKPPLSAEQYYAQALASMVKLPKGSAIASKGVLSIAGACVGGGASPAVNRYLKEWYGQRAAQCKALLQMLAWVEHRAATQLLLAVGSRFRTKSIQEEANTQAQALADRRGWTVAELADRTIPSAGLDETGVLTIDYGPRQFTARLDPDLDFALTDPEGKSIKSLPEPRKDDDEAKAADAKKMFSAAKKELKSVVSMQGDRFYEAMCTQRTWSFEDWNLYLNQHPIVKHHCQRLVWAVIRNDKAAQLFRPLDDGSLTDVADDPVKLDGAEMIRVAHECQVTSEDSRKWLAHLKDYNVETLFEQFGRQNFQPTEEQKAETELGDFQGHLLETFKLRGRATKLGYTRGQAQDGGWFFDYHKRFPTLGIESVIEFTGNGLPEENRTVALTNMHFDRIPDGEASGESEKMPLSEVPPVLLSECWNDMRSIAAEGPGFDPDWEQKSQL